MKYLPSEAFIQILITAFGYTFLAVVVVCSIITLGFVFSTFLAPTPKTFKNNNKNSSCKTSQTN